MRVNIKPVGNGSFNVYKDDVLYAKELIHSEAILLRKSLIDEKEEFSLVPLDPEKLVRDYGKIP